MNSMNKHSIDSNSKVWKLNKHSRLDIKLKLKPKSTLRNKETFMSEIKPQVGFLLGSIFFSSPYNLHHLRTFANVILSPSGLLLCGPFISGFDIFFHFIAVVLFFFFPFYRCLFGIILPFYRCRFGICILVYRCRLDIFFPTNED